MTLKHGEKAAGRIAADANVLLSAVTGRAALKVFTQSHLEVVSTTLNIQEVREYIPVMAGKYGISVELLESQFQLLALKEYGLGIIKVHWQWPGKKSGKETRTMSICWL